MRVRLRRANRSWNCNCPYCVQFENTGVAGLEAEKKPWGYDVFFPSGETRPYLNEEIIVIEEKQEEWL